MNVDELLDKLDSMLDKSWSLPLSGGRCVIDVEQVRSIIDDIRLTLPSEVRQAKAIVADRTEIIKNAKTEASGIVRAAQEKSNALVAENEIVRQAKDKAAEILNNSAAKSKEVRVAAADFADNLMRSAEESLGESLTEIKKARKALKGPAKL